MIPSVNVLRSKNSIFLIPTVKYPWVVANEWRFADSCSLRDALVGRKFEEFGRQTMFTCRESESQGSD